MECEVNGEFVFRGARGRRLPLVPGVPTDPGPSSDPVVPTSSERGIEPAEALIRELKQRGVQIDEGPPEPSWCAGEQRFDLGFAIETLWGPTSMPRA